MSTKRWTKKKLNRLADVVSQLTIQVQQMQLQMVQLSDRVDRTCHSLDGLVNALQQGPAKQPEPNPSPTDAALTNAALNARFQQMEQQIQQLGDRVKALERRELTMLPPPIQPPVQPMLMEDDDIEDEPDEILWDFLEPSERMNRS